MPYINCEYEVRPFLLSCGVFEFYIITTEELTKSFQVKSTFPLNSFADGFKTIRSAPSTIPKNFWTIVTYGKFRQHEIVLCVSQTNLPLKKFALSSRRQRMTYACCREFPSSSRNQTWLTKYLRGCSRRVGWRSGAQTHRGFVWISWGAPYHRYFGCKAPKN